MGSCSRGTHKFARVSRAHGSRPKLLGSRVRRPALGSTTPMPGSIWLQGGHRLPTGSTTSMPGPGTHSAGGAREMRETRSNRGPGMSSMGGCMQVVGSTREWAWARGRPVRGGGAGRRGRGGAGGGGAGSGGARGGGARGTERGGGHGEGRGAHWAAEGRRVSCGRAWREVAQPARQSTPEIAPEIFSAPAPAACRRRHSYRHDRVPCHPLRGSCCRL